MNVTRPKTYPVLMMLVILFACIFMTLEGYCNDPLQEFDRLLKKRCTPNDMPCISTYVDRFNTCPDVNCRNDLFNKMEEEVRSLDFIKIHCGQNASCTDRYMTKFRSCPDHQCRKSLFDVPPTASKGRSDSFEVGQDNLHRDKQGKRKAHKWASM